MFQGGSSILSLTAINDVSGYLARAADLRQKAESSVFPDIKAHLLDVAESWETLARAAAQFASPFAATPSAKSE
jgi:hypothetical protein